MIIVGVMNETLWLKCETMDDLSELMPIVSAFSTTKYETSSMVTVNLSELDRLNSALVPIKSRLKIDDSFLQWKKSSNDRPAIIRVGVIETKIIKGSEQIPHKDIEDVTKYFVKSAFNSKQFKEKKWDGYIKLYKRWEHTFPTGLLGEVLAALTQKGFKYKVEYVYETSPDAQFNWTICDGLIPDPDQVEAVNIAKQGKRGVVKAPTGFGKVA